MQLCAAASLKAGAASHRASGRIHRLDGLEQAPELELSNESATARLPGVVQHRVKSLPRCDLITIGGIRCTGLARTLVDLGSVAAVDVVERAFDDAMRRGANPRWLRETAERLRRPGQAGPLVLMSLLDEFERRGTVRGSWFEKLLQLALVHPELAGITIQHRIERPGGTHVATFDLAVPDAKLGIEAHSRRHHFGALAESSDELRDHHASTMGWDVMYLGYLAVRRPDEALQMVLDRVRTRREILGGGSSA